MIMQNQEPKVSSTPPESVCTLYVPPHISHEHPIEYLLTHILTFSHQTVAQYRLAFCHDTDSDYRRPAGDFNSDYGYLVTEIATEV